MADVQIVRSARSAVPASYVLPDAADFTLKAVQASFDGSGAAGAYLPCVTILSDSGHVVARAVDQAVSVAAGGNAEVSWFPWLKHRAAAPTPSGLSCVLLGKANGTTTLTVTLDTAVPAKGTLQLVCGQVSVPDGVDAGSEITGVVDSGGHGPWAISSAHGLNPVIANSRETDAGNAWSLQASSATRACVGGDLGIGSTVTATFSSVAPANFHSAGLLVYVPAYYVSVTQDGIVRFNMTDAHPSGGASLTTMSWDIDYGPPPWRHSDKDAVMCTAMAAYPATAGFSPFNGSLTGEIATGVVSIAAGCVQVCEGSMPDPGGTWPAGASGLAGNYQVMQPRTCLTG
jgi:hypothetical protein